MKQERTTLEVIAPTVEEAIARGLNQLGLSRDRVSVEVLDPGSRGFLGIGSRQARVKLSVKTASEAQAEVTPTVPEAGAPPRAIGEDLTESGVPLGQWDEHKAVEVAQRVVGELLDHMKVHARLRVRIQPPQEENAQSVVWVEVQGDDLSILIGRRSETLNALQYISSLIVSREMGVWVPLVIDVQGYRARRERQLRILARRMAEQAVLTGRRQVLEPMPANERRIIHLELRDHPEVMTESIGEEPNRKVTIVPKRPARRS
ncbi:RNA-binding cell elongation regulator Jag/EloR [uncultured Thermanaerothrix sp.]|uniref:RNA-binding cell elongation regulator Jag/EloR n=1 Tax=uncultured Thermanaerothrix sp. TaxID=1195149 RepID=UPI0026051B6E|nr:RNA-binding cell elongation regulator Jag/EloR [uncultured Thermanaerothrix sp.]